MKIDSISVVGMWSLGKDSPTRIDDCEDVTILIGKNNSGKSNILRCISTVLNWTKLAARQPYRADLPTKDVYQIEMSEPFRMPSLSATMSFNQSDLLAIAKPHDHKHQAELAQYALSGHSLYARTEAVPAASSNSRSISVNVTVQLSDHAAGFGSKCAVSYFNTPEFMDSLGAYVQSKHAFIPGWRRVSDKPSRGNPAPNFVKALHSSQGASSENPTDRKLFSTVQTMFRELTGLTTAVLQPAAEGNDISVEWNGRYLPLESFGSGFTHLLMIAYELCYSRDSILLIEEPEQGIHPQLQRVFLKHVRYLLGLDGGRFRNQLFITTHSPVFLDSGIGRQIVQMSHDGHCSRARRVVLEHEQYAVLDDLDVRPSDLLQANCVIWVEGPSDRTFILACLALVDSSLAEGIHYQIMFFGGRLLSHLEFGDNDERLVNALRLCRSAVLVSDSDRSSTAEDISPTKRRVHDECVKMRGMSWITAGREIENYLSDDTVRRTLSRLTGSTFGSTSIGQFDPFDKRISQAQPAAGAVATTIDDASRKSKYMHEFVKDLSKDDLDVLDLRARLSELVAYIHSRNTSHPD